MMNSAGNLLGGLLQHVVSVPPGDGGKGDGPGTVTDVLDEVGSFLDDFVETFKFAPLRKVFFLTTAAQVSTPAAYLKRASSITCLALSARIVSKSRAFNARKGKWIIMAIAGDCHPQR